MLKKENFFKDYFKASSNYNKNLKKTKKVFNSFLYDLENNKIPLLASYEKDYEFDFTNSTVKKFLKCLQILNISSNSVPFPGPNSTRLKSQFK